MNLPPIIRDCGRLVGILNRGRAGSWSALRWWWAGRAATATSWPWRRRLDWKVRSICFGTNRRDEPGIPENRPTAATRDGRRVPICTARRAGTNPDWPKMAKLTTGRRRSRHRSRPPIRVPAGNSATGNLAGTPALKKKENWIHWIDRQIWLEPKQLE